MADRTHAISQHHPGHSIACPCVFGQSLTERWGARLALILAATLASSLLEHWLAPNPEGIPYTTRLWHAFVYSACIGLEFFYSFNLFSERISRQPFPLNWLWLFLTVTVSAALGSLTAGMLLFFFGACSWHEYVTKLPIHLRFSVLLGLVFGMSFFLYESLKRQLEATTLELRTKQLEEERARKLAIAAQLSSLESRVRPHFLFNTLNSISALIREEPAQAERMVERLSAMLRFSLDSNQRSLVLLRDEVKIVTDYLEIEKARFGDRLRFRIDVPAEFGTLKVPPFALQTLVENSIKHAIGTKRGGGEITIQAEALADGARLTVRDDGPGFTAEAMLAGHGLENLRDRLYACFGEQAALEICSAGERTEVAIALSHSS